MIDANKKDPYSYEEDETRIQQMSDIDDSKVDDTISSIQPTNQYKSIEMVQKHKKHIDARLIRKISGNTKISFKYRQDIECEKAK